LCFCLFCGSVLFVLIFMCQIFFRIYSNTSNLTALYINDIVFLFLYWIVSYIIILFSKKGSKIFLKIFIYIILPFFLSCVLLILAQALFYRGTLNLIFDFITLLFLYFVFGFWAIGLLSGLIDLIISYLLRKKKLPF
jgi:hypothetical protein